MIRRKALLQLLMVVFLIQVFCNRIQAQDEKFKAIFVYNFTKYINWPNNSGDFVIAILGNSSIISELHGIASKKMVGTSPIEIKTAGSPEEIPDCKILYITSAKTNLLPQLLANSLKKNVLIITEKTNACAQGSGINFINTEGKTGFEISKTNIEKAGLSVSAELLRMGKAL